MANSPEQYPGQDRVDHMNEKRRARQRQKRLSALMTALATLLLIGVILLILGGGSEQLSGWLHGGQAAENETHLQRAETDPDDKFTTVTIAAVGDISISDEQIRDAAQADGSYDFTPCFFGVADILSRADLAVGNLECNFCGLPYSGSTANAPEALAEALAGCGLDLLQTANSYSIANGMDGLVSTISYIEQAGMQAVGTFPDSEYRSRHNGVTLCEVNDMTIAFVAFTKGLGSMSLPEGAEGAVNLLYTDYDSNYSKLNKTAIVTAMEAAQKLKPDLTIALVHWGSEYENKISSNQQSIADLLLENGANAIIGTHSHIPGAIETSTITTDDGARDVLVAYDLGNFYTSVQRPSAQLSIVLELEFTRNNWTGKVMLTDCRYTPIFCADNGEDAKNRYAVQDVEAAATLFEQNYIYSMSEAAYNDMQAALELLEDRIHPAKDDAG